MKNAQEGAFILLEYEAFKVCFKTSENLLQALQGGLADELRRYAEALEYKVTIDDLVSYIRYSPKEEYHDLHCVA
ncbi:MAG: hypothetical protein A2293_08545 [Elusimicrobia bacterium RIFOXYB2_FULL_49_7]|nr:MAG: hypothetical protein A2293_08545 [Elusimicrobia bacterium RIFOXYB2_FULL_49_7]